MSAAEKAARQRLKDLGWDEIGWHKLHRRTDGMLRYVKDFEHGQPIREAIGMTHAEALADALGQEDLPAGRTLSDADVAAIAEQIGRQP